MIAIIDYDAGNLKSVEKALVSLGEDCIVTRDAETILGADKVILPGVGAFGDAMEKLHRFGLVEVIRKVAAAGTPFLGICLGLQLLFRSSDESPGVEGIGLLDGEIVSIPPKEGYKIPHMGWNSIEIKEGARLFQGHSAGSSYVYFVHSYYLTGGPSGGRGGYHRIISCRFMPLWSSGNVFACQFHPEKSGDVGLQILRELL